MFNNNDLKERLVSEAINSSLTTYSAKQGVAYFAAPLLFVAELKQMPDKVTSQFSKFSIFLVFWVAVAGALK